MKQIIPKNSAASRWGSSVFMLLFAICILANFWSGMDAFSTSAQQRNNGYAFIGLVAFALAVLALWGAILSYKLFIDTSPKSVRAIQTRFLILTIGILPLVGLGAYFRISLWMWARTHG